MEINDVIRPKYKIKKSSLVNRNKMKGLKSHYQRVTRTYVQLLQSDGAYMYEVTDSETDHVYYEVFEKRYNRRFNCICYPTDKAFGKWAWCISRGNDHVMAFEAALKRFEFLHEHREAA